MRLLLPSILVIYNTSRRKKKFSLEFEIFCGIFSLFTYFLIYLSSDQM